MADKPTTEGGVWGSYVDYLSTLENELKAAQATVQTLTSVNERLNIEMERLRTIIGELGVAEAAEPEVGDG